MKPELQNLSTFPTSAVNFGAVKTVRSVLDQLLAREAMFSFFSALNFGAVKTDSS
jgi:hypothetical protein